jgi:hypothetical protein
MNVFVVLKHRGRIYRVEKLPFESQEQAMDRAWYIATRLATDAKAEANYENVCFDSLKWVYTKYLHVSYK